MDRLTARDPDGKAYLIECRNNPKCKRGCGDYKCNLIERVAEQLAKYEENNKNGRQPE